MSEFRVVVAGGGIAGLESVIALRSLGGRRVAPVLISPQEGFAFRASEVAEPFGAIEPMRFAVSDVMADLDVPHVLDSVARVEPARRAVVTATGRAIEYD